LRIDQLAGFACFGRAPQIAVEFGAMSGIIRSLVQLSPAVSLLLAFACTQTGPAASSPPSRLVQRIGTSMGSELRLTAWTADEVNTVSAFEAVFREMDRLDGLMSTWHEDSDIERLNAAAGKHPVQISAEVRDVLETARQISDWTGGKFDITFGVLGGLWKFDYQNKDDTIPDREEVLHLLPLINYRDLEVDERSGTAFLKRKGMRANLGGIGKGYAVDQASDILRQRGIRDFMVQFGGDMYVAGHRDGRPWRLGIRDPRGPSDRIFASMDLSDRTFSTSGDYERFFIKDGRRYHHIIDPSSGEPSEGCRSVTIVTDRAVIADGVAKGIFILGPEAGMALIERLPGVEGVIVSAKNQVLVSKGLNGRLRLVAPPTDAP
jgi:thiamine biosynthesis lipoprotein